MSDPVTNIEIEDVLSSIRRLVSDEARAHERGDDTPSFSSATPPQPVELEEEKATVEQENAGRRPYLAPAALMLTPALRIEPDAPKADQPDEGETAEKPATSAPTLILSQDSVAHEPLGDIADNIEENSTKNAPEPSAASEVQNEDQHDDHAEHSDVQSDSNEQTADVSEVNAQMQPQEFAAPQEPSNHEMDDAPLAEANFMQSFKERLDEAHGVEVADEQPAEPSEVSSDTADDEPLTIEDKIAALEALISRSDSDFEPDGAEVGGNAGRPGRTLPWEDSKEPRAQTQDNALPDPQSASQEAMFVDGDQAFQRAHSEAVSTAQAELEENATETLLTSDDQAGFLDEEALRDMVSEIVRQELQGPLGERITRNVRKLVRREIYRALAANELE